MIDFYVTKENLGARIAWSTASELNNEYFIVQKSHEMNFSSFEVLNPISGNGTSNVKHQYQTYDSFPYSYYRLVQVDYDGTEHVSKIVKLENDRAEVRFYPNPVSGNGVLQLQSDNQIISVSLYNLEGRQLFSQNGVESIDFAQLNSLSKVFIVHVETETGVFREKIILN